MSKVTLKLWKKDSPEPEFYDKVADPLHQTDAMSGCADYSNLLIDLTNSLKNWLADKKTRLEDIQKALKASWNRKGGSDEMFNKALEQAFINSGYYKNFK